MTARSGRTVVAIGLAAAVTTAAIAVAGGWAIQKPCKLLTAKLAREYAPGVRSQPDANTAFTCDYSDGKPPSKNRWLLTFEIPFRPTSLSARKLWQIEYQSFTSGPVDVTLLTRSLSGADKAFRTVVRNENALVGDSLHLHIAWVKGGSFGHLDLTRPVGDYPANPYKLLRILMKAIR